MLDGEKDEPATDKCDVEAESDNCDHDHTGAELSIEMDGRLLDILRGAKSLSRRPM